MSWKNFPKPVYFQLAAAYINLSAQLVEIRSSKTFLSNSFSASSGFVWIFFFSGSLS